MTTPVFHEDRLLLSGLMLQLDPDKPAASVLWPDTRAVSRRTLSVTSTASKKGRFGKLLNSKLRRAFFRCRFCSINCSISNIARSQASSTSAMIFWRSSDGGAAGISQKLSK